MQDRKETDMLLAPTHEEEITRLVASELQSGRQLPIRLYQIGMKHDSIILKGCIAEVYINTFFTKVVNFEMSYARELVYCEVANS